MSVKNKPAAKKAATKTADVKPEGEAPEVKPPAKSADGDLIAAKMAAGLSREQATEVVKNQKAYDKQNKKS